MGIYANVYLDGACGCLWLMWARNPDLLVSHGLPLHFSAPLLLALWAA